MSDIKRVDGIDALKALADNRRLAILRRLMAGPATLTQLGQAFGKHAAWIRHHLVRLEQAGLVELAETRPLPGFTEKYYRATSRAFAVNLLLTPEPAGYGTLIVLGSHDLALGLLAGQLAQQRGAPALLTLAVGSLDGLIALRQGSAHLAGCHLLDAEGSYNAPFVSRLFPDQDMALITLAHREQGLMVAPGNPLGLTGLPDLAREGVRFVNRNRGSGTRLWLDHSLRLAGVDAATVSGYGTAAGTHTEVAEAIATGRADAGLGLLAAARQAGLGFVPLFHERYDLAVPAGSCGDPLLQPLFDQIAGGAFRRAAQSLGGYDTCESGNRVSVAAQ